MVGSPRFFPAAVPERRERSSHRVLGAPFTVRVPAVRSRPARRSMTRRTGGFANFVPSRLEHGGPTMRRFGIAASLPLLLLLTQPAAAVVPQTMSYQGVLTDNTGAIVPNGNYDLLFK